MDYFVLIARKNKNKKKYHTLFDLSEKKKEREDRKGDNAHVFNVCFIILVLFQAIILIFVDIDIIIDTKSQPSNLWSSSGLH